MGEEGEIETLLEIFFLHRENRWCIFFTFLRDTHNTDGKLPVSCVDLSLVYVSQRQQVLLVFI